jgi:ATP-binding cassette subfamily G (WHITE) protein 2 (PDR)
MLQAIGAAPGSHTEVDWHQTWLESPELSNVRDHLEQIKKERSAVGVDPAQSTQAHHAEFAASLFTQYWVVQERVFQQYWRTPSYIWSKFFLSIATGLFIGFSFFKADTSLQGLQSQLFSVFMMFTIFGQLVQQIMPNFVAQRDLYEVRERPAKTYSWKIFILTNIVIEIPWNLLVATVFFCCYYFPVGYYNNAIPTNAVNLRGAQMWLFMQAFFMFTSTFATAIIAGMELAETAGNIANLMFSLCLIFCGILATASSLPGFWIFMYRVSPFTYMVQGIMATALANTAVVCTETELLHFDPPSGQTCGAYLQAYESFAGGYLVDDNATSNCAFCTVSSTNVFLENFSISYNDVWRNFGLIWVFIAVNIIAAFGLYWLARVPKKAKRAPKEANLPASGGSEKPQKEVQEKDVSRKV